MLIATAGHIDHGKTLLVKALTGVDTDRLPEEKARGISIDLGFAYPTLPGGERVGFIDVPGHERFVRNMLAGVSGIDFALVVIAADDGVMPQTIEHAQILDLLGVSAGCVAVTKIDRVEPARVAEVEHEIVALLAGTPLAGSPIYPVSAITGDGIEALRDALAQAARKYAAGTGRLREDRPFRLAVDRVFSVAGSGTVVTGTVFDGTLRRGDHVMVAPRGVSTRIRGIQSRGETVESVQAGDRAALNLADVERDAVTRGDWVVAPELDRPTRRLDASLRLVSTLDAPLAHWTPVHLHTGTADVLARVAVPQSGSLAPGSSSPVQLILAEPVVALVGDRFIVRDQSARRTLGGGVVIDPFAPATRRNSAPRLARRDALATLDAPAAFAALLAVADRPVDIASFGASFGLTDPAMQALIAAAGAVALGRDAPVAVQGAIPDRMREALIGALAERHRAAPQSTGFEIAELRESLAPQWPLEAFTEIARALANARRVQIDGGQLRIAGHDTTSNPADEKLWQGIVPALVDAGWTAPNEVELARTLGVALPTLKSLLHRKAKSGELVRVGDDRFYLRATFATLAASATALGHGASKGTFTAAEFRDATGIGRTLGIKILETLDTMAITMRIGDARKIRKDYAAILGAAEPIPDRRRA